MALIGPTMKVVAKLKVTRSDLRESCWRVHAVQSFSIGGCRWVITERDINEEKGTERRSTGRIHDRQ